MPPGPRTSAARSQHELSVALPYRLDLTVSVLRRLSSNVVDVLTPDGRYMRAFSGLYGPVVVQVTQVQQDTLDVTIDGDARAHGPALELVGRVLGVDRDLAQFNRAAARIPWLKPLARRMRGVKPPRYPTLWEACVNAIVFQQISLQAASTILRRLIAALSPALVMDDVSLYEFPAAATMQAAKDGTLRDAGLSRNKLTTLRRAADALDTGALDPALLEELPSAEAAALLRSIKGIGPWTASLILLRGLGRLDVFPGNDSSVLRNLELVSDSPAIDLDEILDALSPQQGMLYYHLLLARLETRGDVGRASDSSGRSSARDIE